MSLLIKNGLLTDPVTGMNKKKADILIEGQKIKSIGSSLKAGSKIKTYDARGAIVSPGLFDMHVHLREPGQENKEKISTGTRSAAMGGFTSLLCMPNTAPVIDSVLGLKFIQMLASKEGVVRVYPAGAITQGQHGKELTEIGDMIEQGALALSDDGHCVMDADLMKRALDYSRMFGIPLIQHAEDTNLAEDGQINEGYMSTITGLKGIPSLAEEVIIARDILLSGYVPGRIHFAHISTKGSAELIRTAKKKSSFITCEVTPHHFSLTEEKLSDFDTNYKMNPPLRTEADRKAMIRGLKDGTIDVIASDHAPHTIFEKEREFDFAPFGIIGLETLVPLSFTELVKPGHLTEIQVIEKLTKNPSRILGLPCEGLKPGAPADITVIDMKTIREYKKEDIISKGCNTPFIGASLIGWPILTVVDGKVIMQNRKLLV